MKKLFLLLALPVLGLAQTCSNSVVSGSIICKAYAVGSGFPSASATLTPSSSPNNFQAGDTLVVGSFLQRPGSPTSQFNSSGGNISATQTSIPYITPPSITTTVTTSTSSQSVQFNASTSTTSLTIQTGSTGSITTGTTYPVGMALQIVNAANSADYMYGTATASTPLAVNVSAVSTAVGTVTTLGTAVTWVSGHTFDTNWSTGSMYINGVSYAISSINSSTSITLATSAGTQTGVAYSIPETGAVFSSWNISSGYCNAYHNDRGGEVLTGSAFAAGITILTCIDATHIKASANPTATGSSSVTFAFQFPSVTGIAAVTANSNGSGYPLGAILDVTQAGSNSMGQVEVTSVGVGGTVTGVQVTSTTPANFLIATGYSIASGVSTTCALPVSGCGTGATINITDIGWILTVTDSGLGPGYEKMLVTTDSGTAYTVRRGYAGTVAIPHLFSGFCSTCAQPYGAYNPGPSPIQMLDFQDTGGNAFACINSQTEYTDTNTVPITFCYTTFTSGTAAAANLAGTEVISITQNYQSGNVNSLGVGWYRGDGAVSGISNPVPTDGYASNPIGGGTSFNTSMVYNSAVPSVPNTGWTVSPGDHCIVLAAGEVAYTPVSGSGAVFPTGLTNASVTITGGNTITGSGFGGTGGALIYGWWPPGTPLTITGASGNPYHVSSINSTGTVITTIESTLPNGAQTMTVADQGAQPNPSSGWVLRVPDATGNRFGFVDNIASGNTCNGGLYQQAAVDGMLTIGVAFHPYSSTPNYGQSAAITSTAFLSSSAPAISASSGIAGVDFVIHDIVSTSNNPNFIQIPNIGAVLSLNANNGSGTVSVNGTAVTYISGNAFSGTWGTGTTIMLGGTPYTIASAPQIGTSLTLTTSAGISASESYSVNSYGIGIYNARFGGTSKPLTTCSGNVYTTQLDNIASVSGHQPVYVRYQVNFNVNTDYYEIWDGTGTRIAGSYCTWQNNTGSNSGGIAIGPMGSTSNSMKVGFFEQYSTLKPMNSKMPTFGHANTNCVFDYHLDTSPGDLVDSCGGAYPLTNTGSVAFADTPAPIQALIKSVPVQAGPQSTSVSGWKTLASGGSQQMDCNAQSITQYNGSDVMSVCSWGQTIGTSASVLSFTSTSAAQPTISNILATNTSSASATDYIVTLAVTDANSNSASGSIEMGAVQMDANGVVTNLTTAAGQVTGAAAQFFPPLMSYGNIPWGETDTLQYQMIGLQTTYQAANGQYQQALTEPAAGGTISYPFTAKGQGFGIAGTTLCSAILGTTDTTVTVCDGSKISTPPTWIMVGTIGSKNAFELIRVVSCSGSCSASPATFNVGYDGRGLSSNASAYGISCNAGIPDPLPCPLVLAQAWSNGTTVGEMRVQGTSTKYLSDATRPGCASAPASGTGGFPVGLNPTTSTITSLAAGATTVVGSGTNWQPSIVGQNIFISAAHSSTAFNLWRQVTGWTDATHITIDHATPAGMDTFSGSVTFSTPQYMSLEFVAPSDGHVARILQPIFGCESETAMFGVGAKDFGPLDATTQSGNTYSWQTVIGTAGAYGPNFYGSAGLAPRNFYLRSGYTAAFNLANFGDEYWSRGPEVGDGFAGGFDLNQGGGVFGAVADLITNPATVLTWKNFEQFGLSAVTTYLALPNLAPAICPVSDTRDSGILIGYGTMLADWDVNNGSTTLNGGITSGATSITVTSSASFQTPPFIAFIGPSGSGSNYEFVRVSAISGSTWTISRGYNPSSSGYAHSSGEMVLSGAALYSFLLTQLDLRDQKCRRNASDGYVGNEINSFTTGGYAPLVPNSGNAYGPLTLTNNSTAGTGLGLSSAMCNGKETGTITISARAASGVLQGASVVGNWERIYIYDPVSGYSGAFDYTASAYGMTSAMVNLAGYWPGTTGTFTYMTENTGMFTVMYSVNDDTYASNERLKLAWACIYNSPTSITLNRPWNGTTGSAYYSDSYAVEGFAQQPFMLGGYKTNQMRWAAKNTTGSLTTDYSLMLGQAGLWIRNYGWDYTNSKGMPYTSVFDVCNPVTIGWTGLAGSSTIHGGDSGNPGCGIVGIPVANAIARVNSVEGGAAMAQCYLAGLCTKADVDAFFGATSGAGQPYGANATCDTSIASTCDGLDAINCELSGMASYKWPGFCTGMGGMFATSWPAIRTLSTPVYNPVPVFGSRSIMGQGVLFLIDPTPRRDHSWMTW